MTRFVVLSLALALFACGGSENDPPGDGAGGGGSGGTGGTSGGGGSGGGEGGTGGTSSLPHLEALEPNHGTVGQRPIYIVGENFVTDPRENRVYFNGIESVVDSVNEEGTRIETSVPSGATTGMVWILTGGVRVNGPTFTVEEGNPVPRINSITPERVQAGTAQTFLLAGSGFSNASRVTVDGAPIASQTRSPTSLQFSLTAEELSDTRAASVVVSNPAPGGGDSEPIEFVVYDSYGLWSAVDLGERRVLLAFSDRPTPSLVTEPAIYSVTGASGSIPVASASRLSGNPRHVELRLAQPLLDDEEYTVQVRTELESEFGGTLTYLRRKAKFRSIASLPGLLESTGGPGCGLKGFSGPTGVSRAPPNYTLELSNAAVVERTGHQVQLLRSASLSRFLGWDGSVLTAHDDEAAAVGCPGEVGSSIEGGFSAPRGRPVFAGGGEILVIGDTGNGRLQTYRVPTFDPDEFGEVLVTGLDSPVLLDSVGDELLVAVATDEVKKFAVDGTPLGSFGAHGAGPGQFDFAIASGETPSLAVDGDGALLIAEPGNHRIQRWVGGQSTGWLGGGAGGFRTTACCAAGQDQGWFDRPRGVAVDAAGQLYVADLAGGGRLQKFDATGGFLWQYPLGFEPGGIYLDLEGVLWVTDVTDDQLHVYRL